MSKTTLAVYNVRERGDRQKAIWTRIGAAWKHDKGDGYNVELECPPPSFPAKLVLMPPKADDAG